jgi:tetrahydromethanopterin S-methyltransferase subunit B
MQVVVNDGVLSPWEPGIFSLVIFGILILALIALLLFVCRKIAPL